MGLLKSIGDFLFGKSPDIFDNNGNIIHKLSKRTWDAWNGRIKMDPNYNWRNHRGTKSKTREGTSATPNPNSSPNKVH